LRLDLTTEERVYAHVKQVRVCLTIRVLDEHGYIAHFDFEGALVRTLSGQTKPLHENDWSWRYPCVLQRLMGLSADSFHKSCGSRYAAVRKPERTRVHVSCSRRDSATTYGRPLELIRDTLAKRDIELDVTDYPNPPYASCRVCVVRDPSSVSNCDRDRNDNDNDNDNDTDGVIVVTPDDYFDSVACLREAGRDACRWRDLEVRSDEMVLGKRVVLTTSGFPEPTANEEGFRGTEFVLMVGAPASGKSTVSEAVFGSATTRLPYDVSRYEVLHGDDPAYISEHLMKAAIVSHVSRGRSVVVDSINATPGRRVRLIIAALIAAVNAASSEAGVSVKTVTVDTPLDVCMARNRARSRSSFVAEVAYDTYRRKFVRPSSARDGALLAKTIADRRLSVPPFFLSFDTVTSKKTT